MNILILNWRDIKNPKGGGAEVLTHEMAKRWVKKGHKVTQFSERFDDSQKGDVVDGVKIVRGGSADIRSFRLPVHIAAYFWYIGQKKECFDVVIDEIHGIPFFTPCYVREKRVALICEVANQIWNVAFSFPLNIIGRIIEKYYFYFYRQVPFLTISPSTRKELAWMGVKKRNITILPMGLSAPKQINEYHKEKNPTLIFVGRLTKAKGMFDAIKVLSLLKEVHPNIQLWMLGQGDQSSIQQIYEIADQLNVRDSLKLFGFVRQDKKFELMNKAHVLIVPSAKEGWGLTVPEAGIVGTPAVVYNVEGLRDVVRQNRTGVLTGTSPERMATDVHRLLSDKRLYKNLQQGAKELAKTYSWDRTADIALSVIQSVSL